MHLTVVHDQQSDLKFVVLSQGRFVFRFPGNDASMLPLHQIPKAEKGIPTEVTTNQDFELVASPTKSERDLSKRSQPIGLEELGFLG